MASRYILVKSGAEGAKQPIDSLTASCMEEAEEALAWLRKHHADRPELSLGEGEFFEILQEDHCPLEEWRGLTEALERMRKARAGAGSQATPRHEVKASS